MRILITLITTLYLTLPAFADMSVSDLPYIEGTPLEPTSAVGPSWTLLDYAEADGGFAWVWLENAGNFAYVVYPSEFESVVFPDGTTVDSVAETLVLHFWGDEDQHLEFTRFGGEILVSGNKITLSYTTTEHTGHSTDETFMGDISIDGANIVLDGEITIEGNLNLVADEMIVLQGEINVGGNLNIVSPSHILLGSGTSNGTALDICNLVSTTSNGDFSHKPSCTGDFFISSGPAEEIRLPPNSGLIVLATEETIINIEAVPTENKQTQSSPQKKSGGNTSGLILGLLTLLALFRKKRER